MMPPVPPQLLPGARRSTCWREPALRLDGARRAGALSCVNEAAAIAFADLDPPEPRVQSAVGHQLVVRPTLDDPPAVENHDQIRIANCGEAMRDHERR